AARMTLTRRAPATAVALLALAGCGGSGSKGASSTSTGPGPPASTTRVQVLRSLAGGSFDPQAIYGRSAPGVVTVISEFAGGASPLGPGGGQAGQGSGFVVSPKGEIATNAHVVTSGEGAGIRRARHVYVQFADQNLCAVQRRQARGAARQGGRPGDRDQLADLVAQGRRPGRRLRRPNRHRQAFARRAATPREGLLRLPRGLYRGRVPAARPPLR